MYNDGSCGTSISISIILITTVIVSPTTTTTSTVTTTTSKATAITTITTTNPTTTTTTSTTTTTTTTTKTNAGRTPHKHFLTLFYLQPMMYKKEEKKEHVFCYKKKIEDMEISHPEIKSHTLEKK